MHKTLLGAAALTMLAGFSGTAYADFTLNILHINDFHSRFESITGSDSNCDAAGEAKSECFGGIARLKTEIDAKRAEFKAAGANSILLSAGDNFQGSLFYTTYKSKVVSDFMNQMGFDVVATGNHEFDDGPAEFSKFIAAAKFPIIGGNFDVSRSPDLKDKIKGSIVLDVADEKIGIVGATTVDTPDISSPGSDVQFSDVAQYVRGAVEALNAAGVTKVIVLSHIGYTIDQKLAAEVPGIDLIVGGHSHTLLSNVAKGAIGPYPTWVVNPDGIKVPIVTADQYGKYLGDLKVTWDDKGVLTQASGEPILLDASVKPDEKFLGDVATLKGPIDEAMKKVVGSATATTDGSRETCRAAECQMGDLIADAILDRVAGQGITIAIQNGGGVRASIDAGDITMGDVLTVLPFSNTLATFKISGKDILASLENGLSDIENGAGRFPQVAGMKFNFTLANPAGKRVISVQVKEGDAWVPLDPAKIYGVVTNNYVRGGGDGYALFGSNATEVYDFGPPLEDVLADYIAKKGGEITPATDGRIVEVKG